MPRELHGPSKQAAWERSELARADVGSDFPSINACTLWSLHSALDDLVERFAPDMAETLSGFFAEQLMQLVEADHPREAAQVPKEIRDSIVASLKGWRRSGYKIDRLRGDGSERWEAPLRSVGMGAPSKPALPADMEVALRELCVLRDVLTHRGAGLTGRRPPHGRAMV